MSSMKNDKLLSLSCCAHNNTLRKKYPKTQYGVVSTTKPKQLNALVNRLLPEQKHSKKIQVRWYAGAGVKLQCTPLNFFYIAALLENFVPSDRKTYSRVCHSKKNTSTTYNRALYTINPMSTVHAEMVLMG